MVNNYLYKVFFDSNIPQDSKVTPVILYDNKGEIKHLNAFSSEPYPIEDKNFLVVLINRFIIFLLGKQSFSVNIEGEKSGEIKLAYVKIKDLSKILQISPKELREKAKQSSITDFLQKHNIEQTIRHVQNIAKFTLNNEDKQAIRNLINRVEYKNIPLILNRQDFDSTKIIPTLLAIGKTLKNPSYKEIKQTEKSYGFKIGIDKNEISILKTESRLEGYFEVNLNLQNLCCVENRVVTPSDTSFKSSRNSTKTNSYTEGKNIIDLHPILDVKIKSLISPLDPQSLQYLKKLIEEVPVENLITLLNQFSKEADQLKLLNTFISIGKEFSTSSFLNTPLYKGRIKDKTFAYGIGSQDNPKGKKNIFITLKTQKEIDQGAFKLISNAIEIHELTPFVRVKVAPLDKNLSGSKLENDRLRRNNAIERLKSEFSFLKQIQQVFRHYLVEAYAFIAFTKKGKNEGLVLFQTQYLGGNATQILKVPAVQQLVVFKDAAYGLDTLHKKKYVHMDAKLSNFLIQGDINGKELVKTKLADFGNVVKIDHEINGGTLKYLPKEAVKFVTNASGKKKISFADHCKAHPNIDSFSLGANLFEVLAQGIKYEGKALERTKLNFFNQNELDLRIKHIQDELPKLFKGDELKIKLKMLEVCAKLIKEKQSERISCLKAAEEFADIEKTLINYNL
jgi:serine/threonine protein kinase